MRTRLHALPVLVVPMVLASCIPVPHTMQDLPRISGAITSQGATGSGVVVHVTDVTRANPCERGERIGQTDAAGNFVTDGRRRLALWVPLLPVHSVDTWAVAFFRDGAAVGYIRPWNYRAGPGYSPREVELSCELGERMCVVHDLTWGYEKTLEIRPCEKFSSEPFR